MQTKASRGRLVSCGSSWSHFHASILSKLVSICGNNLSLAQIPCDLIDYREPHILDPTLRGGYIKAKTPPAADTLAVCCIRSAGGLLYPL
eukprot:gene14488-biopygen3959